jgi:hypothetical protein
MHSQDFIEGMLGDRIYLMVVSARETLLSPIFIRTI